MGKSCGVKKRSLQQTHDQMNRKKLSLVHLFWTFIDILKYLMKYFNQTEKLKMQIPKQKRKLLKYFWLEQPIGTKLFSSKLGMSRVNESLWMFNIISKLKVYHLSVETKHCSRTKLNEKDKSLKLNNQVNSVLTGIQTQTALMIFAQNSTFNEITFVSKCCDFAKLAYN